MKPKHPEFEVIYLTIEDMPETEKFAKELGFNWRTVTYENTTMPSVHPSIDGRIPQLIVMDRTGKVLANGVQGTAPAALQQLDALLKQATGTELITEAGIVWLYSDTEFPTDKEVIMDRRKTDGRTSLRDDQAVVRVHALSVERSGEGARRVESDHAGL